VEVLATLVLIGIVLPVAMRGVSLAMFAGDTAADRKKATVLAESKMAELIATGEWQDTALEGDFATTASGEMMDEESVGEAGYAWSATVEDWVDLSIKELTVRVTWTARDIEHEVSVTTLVHSEEEG